ncbi:MAG: MarR family transcriptional regulator [Streptosporangiales bacterium]|nr:MarR family transcriptional regulator [Streptosporangiales bacterium]
MPQVNAMVRASSGETDERATSEIERQLTSLGLRLDQLRQLAAARSGFGLEKAAYRVLARLSDHGPQRAAAIATCFGLDESTVSRQAEALMAAGLVERGRDPADRRAYLLRPTTAGRRHLADARRGRRELLEALLADWRPQDRVRLADLLGRFNADLERVTSRSSQAGAEEEENTCRHRRR